MNHVIFAPIVLPLITAILLMLLAGRRRLIRSISLLSATALVGVTACLLMLASDGEIRLYAPGNWAPPFGIILVLDRLSAMMLMVTAVLAFFSLAYAVRGHDAPGDRLHGMVHFLLVGVNGAFLTGDLFNLFVFFEILLISSYGLLLHGRGVERARSGLHYVIVNLIGSALFLMGVSALYGITGSLNMADLGDKMAKLDPADAPLAATAGILLLVVFGLKAAMAPFYFWLPRAYAAASAPVAAMFAIMTKVGVYSIIRVYTQIFGDNAETLANFAWFWLWPIALVTLVMGLLGALSARELRVQIAYLVIVSVGTLLAGIALNREAGLAASLYYLVHSTLICGAMFLLADLILRQRGELLDHIAEGPRLRQSALLGVLFFIGAVAVAGLPPFSGFIGKLLLLNAAGANDDALVLWLIVLGGSLLTLIALSRSGSMFFWQTKDKIATAPAADLGALLAVIGLFCCVGAVTVLANPVLDYTQAVARQLLEPGAYLQAVQQFRVR
ncbi:MAG: monovalent cation/H+ antiporter subunit D [Cellvibrio sp.]|uniref:monovalent cation/H+ antiporter subunit D n=1 Tax=Cellvibrio sp. TaxID=1965322 RepID=UPI0031A522A1